MPDPIQAAPAQSTDQPTATPTAVEQAVVGGDLATYREARRAERVGKPLTPKPATETPATETPDPKAAAPAPKPEERQVSKRQQQINTYERTIAEQNERIARLEAGQRSPAAPRSDDPPAPKAPAPAADEKFPKFADYIQTHPDAELEDWIDARDAWKDDQRTKADAQRSTAERREQTLKTRDTQFLERINTRIQADAEFVTKNAAVLQALKPFDMLAEGEQGSAINVVAEELMGSSLSNEIVEHFTANPAELARFKALRSPRDVMREFAKLERDLERPEAPATPPLKTVTSAPSPGTTLGARPSAPGDPVKAAVTTNNFSAFRKERLQQRVAQRNR